MNTTAKAMNALLLLLLAGWSPWASAGKLAFGDTFIFSVGGMQHQAKADFQSTREDRPEIELDMNDLGMDPKASTVWLGATWQFAERWGVTASYSGFDSDGTISASGDGNFGDVDWDVTATLESELDLDLYVINLHWDFINTARTNFGVGLGVHIADLNASIGAMVEADINGVPLDPAIDLGSESAAITAPLPDVSMRLGHRFGESVYVSGTFGYFDLHVGDIDGELISAKVSVDWRPGAGVFGVGAGYQYVSIDVTDDGNSRTERYDTEFYGPVFFVGMGF